MLFHVKVFMPPEVGRAIEGWVLALRYTRHAEEAAKNDRYGFINKPSQVVCKASQLIEAEIEHRRLIKIVLRTLYDGKLDLTLAIMPNFAEKTGLVKSLWLNQRSDQHSTLQKAKYCTSFTC